MNKQELSATLSIAAVYVVRMLGLFMVLPVLPLLADDISGATPFLIGLALGGYGLTQAMLQIPMGYLSDRLGRKPILFFGLSLFIVGSLVAALSDSIFGLILGRMLQGCGAIASTLLALLGDVTLAEHRSRSMAIIGMSIGSSFGIALVVGPLVQEAFGLSGIFFLTAALGLAAILILWVFVPTPSASVTGLQVKVDVSCFREVLSHPGLIRVTFGVFTLHYLLMSGFVVFPQLMLGTGEIEASEQYQIYFVLLGVTFVLMGPFMWLSDKPNFVKPLMTLVIGFLLASSVVLSSGTTYLPVMVGMVLFFMGFNLMEVILPSLVSRFAPARIRGTAMGAYSTAQFAGAFVGGALGGYVVGFWDIAHLLWVNAAICAVWLVVLFGLPRPRNMKTLIRPLTGATDIHWREALLSDAAVVDVVLMEEEQLAYIQVDEDLLDDESRLLADPA